MKNTITIPLKIEIDEDGHWLVSCPDLPGVNTFGKNEAEAKEMAVDAMECYLDVCRENGIFEKVLASIGYKGDHPLPDIKIDFNGEILEVRHLNSFAQEAAYG